MLIQTIRYRDLVQQNLYAYNHIYTHMKYTGPGDWAQGLCKLLMFVYVYMRQVCIHVVYCIETSTPYYIIEEMS